MGKFPGFSGDETFTRVPDSFFRQLLAQVDELDELKVILHAIWRVEHMEGALHPLREADFAEALADPAPALEKAVRRGSLLQVPGGTGDLFFLNSPRGRAAAEALRDGGLDPASLPRSVPPPERPNIFRLYEENIGPLTPLIADMLKDAEREYHAEWIAEALEIAVVKNVRNWKYVEAILKRWKEKGKNEGKDRQDAVKDFKRYSEGEFAEFFKHD
ncbi:MAG: DnaD domain protein [Chloroflexi bacterium]|nr:DnaD domain protein [Chloroflexota bacterium]